MEAVMRIYVYPHTTNDFKIYWSCPRTELIITEGLNQLQDVELVHNITQADFIIWHHVPQNYGQKSYEIINTLDPKRLIIIDSIDENNEFFLPEMNPDNYFLYFKRSIIHRDSKGNTDRLQLFERMYPWDYAILDGFIQPEQPKTIDIGCYLRPSCLFRSQILYYMQRYKRNINMVIGEVSNGTRCIGDKVHYDEIYFNYLAKTKIVVSSGPFGWTGCSRASEAFANKCLYISNEAYDYMPNPPIHGEHYIKYNPLSGPQLLYDILDFLLSKEDLVHQISLDGYTYAIKHHSSLARAQYIYSTILSNL